MDFKQIFLWYSFVNNELTNWLYKEIHDRNVMRIDLQKTTQIYITKFKIEKHIFREWQDPKSADFRECQHGYRDLLRLSDLVKAYHKKSKISV